VRAVFVCSGAFAVAFTLDLVTKLCAVAWLSGPAEIIYNDRPHDLAMRLDVVFVTVGVVYLLERFGMRRGIGRLDAAWLCVGVLVAGTLGNGVSTYLWSAGVPDFIHVGGGWLWNVADFEIVFGLLGTALSVVGSAVVAYVRGFLLRRSVLNVIE
jgi:lipoprotein signal peptidase